ncbi:ARM repeat superfamily protein [Citrus sinensis]|nr:ARM repeat superfamily protein [Citrus sinensis]
MADLLLLLRDIRTFQFNKVVGLDILLSALANDQSQVAQKITRLLMPSYFPLKVNIKEACSRCVTLVKRSPVAGARFCEFAVSEGAPLESLVELVTVFIRLVLSHDKLDEDQIEGLLAAVSYLCKDIAREQCYKNALKELFANDKVKSLFAAASTGRARSSVFEIVSTVSPDNVVGLLEQCMGLISKCKGLSEDEERQAEVRSAHKLLLSSCAFDDMLEALTMLLQKAVYRCHVKFGTEIPKHNVSSVKRKKPKSAVKISGKWKYASGKKASSFEEDYLIAVGIAWQVKDLLTSEDSRKAMLGSQHLELLFLALKVISEVSILHCMYCDYMDVYPVLAYTALALELTLQNIGISRPSGSGSKKDDRTESTRSSSEAMIDQAMVHLLSCTDELLGGDSGNSSKLSPGSKHDKSNMRQGRGHKVRELQKEASSSNDNGSVCTGQKITSKKVNMLTVVLKFIVDSTALGFLSHIQGSCAKFTTAYVQYVISALGQQSRDSLLVNHNDLKETFIPLKSSFSYAAKLINLCLRDSSEASPPPAEAFDLVNELINLICSVELHMDSGYAARLVVVAKAWLLDLILALGSGCIFYQSRAGGVHFTASDHFKVHFPWWLLILARTELDEISKVNSDEDNGRVSKQEEFPEFKKFMELIIPLLKGNPGILDAVGVVFLTGSVVGLERKDFGLFLGLVHFVCVKLIGADNREWNGLDAMLVSLPDIYPRIEKEIEEQSQEDERQKLLDAKVLLEPVWMHHVFETERFSVMEEDMDS